MMNGESESGIFINKKNNKGMDVFVCRGWLVCVPTCVFVCVCGGRGEGGWCACVYVLGTEHVGICVHAFMCLCLSVFVSMRGRACM